MFKSALIFWIGTIGFTASAIETLSPHSALRKHGVSYQSYMERARVQAAVDPSLRTPANEAVEYDKATLPAATAWESMEVLQERFMRIRDERFLSRPARPDFPRRSSWLFPDDGCFARAQLANQNLQRWEIPAPSKAFVFGNLRVDTPNSPEGSVGWWYHVVPVVEVKGEKWVLDPAIDARAPMRLFDWLARQSYAPETLQVAICGSGAYTPYDNCAREVSSIDQTAQIEQGPYLDAEWRRVQALGRDPEQELGDNPPW